jgi:antitoxin component of RelBE/YafQ-DinJ toxin-antitoxin module
MKKSNDKLTISVDKAIKDKFKEFCEERGLKIGKQLEIFMKKELNKEDKNDN